jgi:hypothetical protein
MTDRTLFFSWQADPPNSTGRSFLRGVLNALCTELSSEMTVSEAIRVDSDTQGEPGQAPIVQTIQRKIDEAAVFVADMTFVGQLNDGRLTPNPNVLIEYGWALKSIGHGRVISVMNTAKGSPKDEPLPFDLAHMRWPILYELHETTSAETRVKVKQVLKKTLTTAIRASLATLPAPIQPTPAAAFKPASCRWRGDRIRGWSTDGQGIPR